MSKSQNGFARANPSPLELVSHYKCVGRRGWRKPFTKIAVCVVDACTELLIANSTIGRNPLQSVKDWMYPRSISSRTRLTRSVSPSVSGWSEVYIITRIPRDRNTNCQIAAVNRESLSDTSSRSRPWSRNTVSMKTQAQPCAEIDSLTCSKMYHLAESVYEHKNTVILVSIFGETEDKVD